MDGRDKPGDGLKRQSISLIARLRLRSMLSHRTNALIRLCSIQRMPAQHDLSTG